nr:glycosyltransferase [uncultured Sulfurimonas sp.]
MKILFIIDTMSAGGAQKVLLSHCEYLVKCSHQVTLVSLKKINKHKISDKINYIELIDFNERITTNIFNILQELSVYVKQAEIIVGFSDFIVNYIAYLSAKIYDKPLLICVRNQLSKQIETYPQHTDINKDLMSSILSNSNVLVQSEVIKKDMFDNFNIKNAKVTVLANPISMKIIKPKNIFDSHKKNIVVVGRLSIQKNILLIIKSLSLLKKEYLERLYLHIIGDGDEHTKLEKEISSLNLNKYVKFHGYKKEVLPYISEADIMILASRFEGQPNVILEAFSQNTLVLASDIEPIKELVDDNENGVLFKDNDVDSLVSKLIYCLDNDLNKLVKNAYVSLNQYSDVHHKFENILKNIVSDYEKKS